MVLLSKYTASCNLRDLNLNYQRSAIFSKVFPNPVRYISVNRLSILSPVSASVSAFGRRTAVFGTVLGLSLVVALANDTNRCVRAFAGNEQRKCEVGTLRTRLASMFREPSLGTLIDELKGDGRLQTPEIEKAMRAVDRRFFVPDTVPDAQAYQDYPIPIGYGETISAPHMHATALELLAQYLRPGAQVLDVGSGSGYLTAVMGVMVGEEGRVMGFEKHPELVEASIRSVKAAVPGLLENGRISLANANVLDPATLANEGPFDAIHVGAAAAEMPEVLVQKLKSPGRMVIPVGPQNDYQVLEVVDKDVSGAVGRQQLMYVRYVPLTKPLAQGKTKEP